MFGLRQKLVLGFGGLLAILLIVSALGVAVLSQYRNELDKFYYENWRSVEYGQHMIEDIEGLNDTVKILNPASSFPSSAELITAQHESAPLLANFDENITAECHNLTLNGEKEIAERLSEKWSGHDLSGKKIATDCYRDAYVQLSNNTAIAERPLLVASLARLSRDVTIEARNVIRLNLDNMKPIEGQAKALADNATRLMILLAVTGVGLAAVFTVVVGRSILQPLTMLTRSFREIEQGNLDLVVQVKSRDELHQLAEAFNSMAAKLREFRRTDRAKLLRTQRTTQLAVNSLPDAIAIINPEGVIELSNENSAAAISVATWQAGCRHSRTSP